MAQEIHFVKRILVHHLALDEQVVELLGAPNRIFTAHGKDSEEATRQQASLVFQFRGGPTATASPTAQPTFWLWAYSNRSQDEASRLYEAAKVVLHTEGFAAPPDQNGDPCFPLCAYFQEVTRPLEDFNPVVDAWWSRGTWRAFTKG